LLLLLLGIILFSGLLMWYEIVPEDLKHTE
jgi:hypothetical protein